MSGYWPWWLGAAALGLITVVYALLVERPLGVSGAWDRVIHWRRERRREHEDAQWSDEKALVEALAAATAAEFGSRPQVAAPRTSRSAERGRDDVRTLEADRPSGASPDRRGHARPPVGPIPVACQLALLISVFVGGFTAALTSGRFDLRADMGPGFSEIVTGNPGLMVVSLFVGGVLVGFGTRLAGGCSSGHGLSGCSRLQPASIIATAVFSGTAVVVSFLLWRVL